MVNAKIVTCLRFLNSLAKMMKTKSIYLLLRLASILTLKTPKKSQNFLNNFKTDNRKIQNFRDGKV